MNLHDILHSIQAAALETLLFLSRNGMKLG
jgi:hypothetical protein